MPFVSDWQTTTRLSFAERAPRRKRLIKPNGEPPAQLKGTRRALVSVSRRPNEMQPRTQQPRVHDAAYAYCASERVEGRRLAARWSVRGHGGRASAGWERAGSLAFKHPSCALVCRAVPTGRRPSWRSRSRDPYPPARASPRSRASWCCFQTSLPWRPGRRASRGAPPGL